jgi:ribosomal protein S6
MPAVEASTEASERELMSYELAFHVLPTIAEGEVATVFANIKDHITKHGGELGLEEAPARIDLAYEIIKYLEGRNRKFGSAYFGWVRFAAEPNEITKLSEEIDGMKELLRHLLVKLTRVEEENPFYYHEAMVSESRSETIEVDEETAVVAAKEDETEAAEATEETSDAVEATEETEAAAPVAEGEEATAEVAEAAPEAKETTETPLEEDGETEPKKV